MEKYACVKMHRDFPYWEVCCQLWNTPFPYLPRLGLPLRQELCELLSFAELQGGTEELQNALEAGVCGNPPAPAGSLVAGLHPSGISQFAPVPFTRSSRKPLCSGHDSGAIQWFGKLIMNKLIIKLCSVVVAYSISKNFQV